MSPTPAAYIAWTSPINPTGSTPLTVAQIWAGLHRKVRHAEEFVPAAIKSTDVISESVDEHGREVVTRDVVFIEGGRKAREICTFYPRMKVEVCTPFFLLDDALCPYQKGSSAPGVYRIC